MTDPHSRPTHLIRTIDYDPLRDQHLRKFFKSPFMQEHMRHAAALDRISARRNPWNDAVEYLMEAGSAYNVKGLFEHNQNQYESSGNTKHNNNSNQNQQRASSARNTTSNVTHRPHPPPPTATATASSSRSRGVQQQQQRPSSSPIKSKQQQQQHQPSRPPTFAEANRKYRNVEGRIDKIQQQPPLPRYSAALRNIRRFDDEVHRILARGNKSEVDQKEEDRWHRMQQRRKVEQMIRGAQSPKFGRHKNEDGGNEDVDDSPSKRRHERPLSLAARHLEQQQQQQGSGSDAY
jgi:hypothetical protein